MSAMTPSVRRKKSDRMQMSLEGGSTHSSWYSWYREDDNGDRGRKETSLFLLNVL
jgi:hypothetical protein